MKRCVRAIVLFAVPFLVTFSGYAATSAREAERLVSTYFLCYIGFCGGTSHAIERRTYWEVPVFVGESAARSGSVRVEKSTGMLSYSYSGRSYPTVSPAQLEHCNEREWHE